MTKFEMNYRKTDMRAFFNDIIKKNLVKKLLAVYSLIGISVFMIMIGIIVLIEGKFVLKPLPFIFLAVLAVIIFFAINRTIRNTPDKIHTEFKSQYDGGTITCTFTPDRVYIESDTSPENNGHLLYTALEKAVETDNYLYLFINGTSAQIIKKSCLVEGSVDEVRRYLKAALGSAYEIQTKLRRN